MASISVLTQSDANSIVLPKSSTALLAESFDQDRQRQCTTLLIGCLSGASLVTALLAMYLEASWVSVAAFGFPLLVAPYTIHQRRQINKLPSLKNEINICRQQVNRLFSQNQHLNQLNTHLAAKLRSLKSCDDKLRQLALENNTSYAFLRHLVTENGAIHRKMTKLSHARDLQAMLSSILACDTNGDNRLSGFELDQLILRLQAFSERPVLRNENAIRRAIVNASQNGSVSTTDLLQITSSVVEGLEDFSYVRCSD